MRQFFKHFAILLLPVIGYSQSETVILDANNARATINHDGIFFKNDETVTPGYEVPKGSGNHAIFSTSFWLGGEDINGNLKLAAQRYDGGRDLFPGALSDDGTATSLAPGSPNGVFMVSKDEIDDHIANYTVPGYVVPDAIEQWPAHGDVDINQDFYLAPFVDVDGNGIYEPENGDYPKIKGDQAAFMILNDKQNIHTETGGDPIGVELHLMFYQYDVEGDVGNTTFLNMKVINRGTQTLYDFYVGCWMDPDIGYSMDDYVGFDSTNSLMYAYNGDLLDEGGAGQPGYEADVPAVGMTLLNRPVSYFMANTSGGGPYGDPSTAADYYNFLRGRGLDGEPGETYMFDGNPNNPEELSELSIGNPAGDRRMLMSTLIPPQFAPRQVLCFDYAIVYGAGTGDAIENVNALLDATANVRDYYDNEIADCEEGFLSIEQEKIKDPFNVYPNPSNGVFQIEGTGTYNIELYGLDGRLILEKQNLNGNQQIQSNLAAGTYLLILHQNDNKQQMKLIIK